MPAKDSLNTLQHNSDIVMLACGTTRENCPGQEAGTYQTA